MANEEQPEIGPLYLLRPCEGVGEEVHFQRLLIRYIANLAPGVPNLLEYS